MRWLVETALDHAPDDDALLARRAQLMYLTGDPGAGLAYGQAAAVATGSQHEQLRIGQAWAWLALGDVTAAQEALAAMPPHPRPRTSREATVRAMVACFAGQLEDGGRLAATARAMAHVDGRPQTVIEAAFVEAMVAHARGDLPTLLRREILTADHLAEIAGLVHDGYLCPVHNWLCSGEPVGQIAAFASRLVDAAAQAGAERGRAFAILLQGEAVLLSGDLTAAGDLLEEARELHVAVGAPGGETLALVALANLAIATGRHREADPLVAAAFDAARRSPLVTWHLLPRTHGARVAAAADRRTALARVEDALGELRGPEDRCPSCWPAFALPATLASARGGRPDLAATFLDEAASVISSRWRRGGWVAGLAETRGVLAALEDPLTARTDLRAAAEEFERCGQVGDAARCRAAAAALP